MRQPFEMELEEEHQRKQQEFWEQEREQERQFYDKDGVNVSKEPGSTPSDSTVSEEQSERREW